MTAAAAETDDAWQEKCLIAISAEGGTDVQFAALTETVDFDIGEKGIEGVPLVNGGRVTKFNPEGDTSVTLEAYPLAAGTDSGAVGKGFFDLMHSTTADANQPQRYLNDHSRTKYRILVLWTNDTTADLDAQDVTAGTFSGLRIGMAEAYITSVKSSFTDGINKFTIVAKCTAFDKAASANVMMESTDGTDLCPLPAIASYTASAKFA